MLHAACLHADTPLKALQDVSGQGSVVVAGGAQPSPCSCKGFEASCTKLRPPGMHARSRLRLRLHMRLHMHMHEAACGRVPAAGGRAQAPYVRRARALPRRRRGRRRGARANAAGAAQRCRRWPPQHARPGAGAPAVAACTQAIPSLAQALRECAADASTGHLSVLAAKRGAGGQRQQQRCVAGVGVLGRRHAGSGAALHAARRRVER